MVTLKDYKVNGINLSSSADAATNSASDVRKALLSILDQINNTQQALSLSQPLADDIAYLTSRVRQFKVTVPLVGKFSSGKSSLLNAYLGRDYLKQGLTPETAFATELVYSAEEQAIVYETDGSQQNLTLDEFAQIEPTDSILYAQLQLDNKQLKKHPGLLLVDMPGFDSQHQSHHRAISRYLERGDLFINLMPSNVAFDSSVMQQLGEIKYGYDKPIVCLISKAARCTTGELNQKKDELAELLAIHLDDMPPVGAVESINSSAVDLKDFERALEHALNNYDQSLIKRYGQAIAELVRCAQSEVRTLINFASSNEAELEENLQAIEYEYQQAEQQLQRQLNELNYNLLTRGQEYIRQQCLGVLINSTEQLVMAAKSNTLPQAINNLLRPTVQSALNQLLQQEVSNLQSGLRNLGSDSYQDLNISLNLSAKQTESLLSDVVDIVTALSLELLKGKLKLLAPLINKIKDMIGGQIQEQQRDQQIRDQIANELIPGVIEDVITQVLSQLNRMATQLSEEFYQTFWQQKTDFDCRIEETQQSLVQCKADHLNRIDVYQSHLRTLQVCQATCESMLHEGGQHVSVKEQDRAE
jgi:predicted GTPase